MEITSSTGTWNIDPQSDAAQEKLALRRSIFVRDLLELQGVGTIVAQGEAGRGRATDVHHHAIGSPYARCTMLCSYRKHRPYITHHPSRGHGIVKMLCGTGTRLQQSAIDNLPLSDRPMWITFETIWRGRLLQSKRCSKKSTMSPSRLAVTQ